MVNVFDTVALISNRVEPLRKMKNFVLYLTMEMNKISSEFFFIPYEQGNCSLVGVVCFYVDPPPLLKNTFSPNSSLYLLNQCSCHVLKM